MKFKYLRGDAPPHDPRDFAPGVEFHELIENLTGQTAIDVGANIGSYTLPLAKRFARVSAFEPSRDHCRILRLNLKLNKLQNVRVYQMALSDVSGSTSLYIRKGGAASLSETHYGLSFDRTSKVITARLDDFLPNFQRLDFVKIDAEGFEMQVIEGGVKMITTLKPVIALEVHRACSPVGSSCNCEVCSRLNELGYGIRALTAASVVGDVHWVWASAAVDNESPIRTRVEVPEAVSETSYVRSPNGRRE